MVGFVVAETNQEDDRLSFLDGGTSQWQFGKTDL